MNFGPYANLLPPLSTAGQQALAASIEAEGVRDPVVLDEDGNVLDGRHRLEVCPDAPRRIVSAMTDAEKRAFVFSSNLARRNLTPDQKRELRRKMKTTARALKAEGKTQADIASLLGVPRETIRDWLTTNGETANGSKRLPDCRMKIDKRDYTEIAERHAGGEKETQIAADFGITQQHVSKIVRRVQKDEENAERIRELANGGYELNGHLGRFPVIYADPPWEFHFAISPTRDISKQQYPTMSLSDICEMPVSEISQRDCVLFLWAPSPKLEEAIVVLKSWGFEYKTCIVWAKDRIGMGHYARRQHEVLLVATKGKLPTPAPENRPASIIAAKRTKHSRKPEEFYEIIERMYPDMPKVELFCRTPRDGWAAWGNEVEAA